jgi:hypothetical protein
MLRCLNITAIGLCVFGLAGCAKDPQSEKQDVRQAEVDAKKKMLDKQCSASAEIGQCRGLG